MSGLRLGRADEALFGDAYYLAIHREQRMAATPATRGTREPHACPCCYRPVAQAGYCDRCEARGDAARHTDQRRAALLTPKPRPQVERHTRPRRRTPEERRARAIDALRRCAAETGVIPGPQRWQRERRKPSHTEIYKLYGTWQAALQAAGILS